MLACCKMLTLVAWCKIVTQVPLQFYHLEYCKVLLATTLFCDLPEMNSFAVTVNSHERHVNCVKNNSDD